MGGRKRDWLLDFNYLSKDHGTELLHRDNEIYIDMSLVTCLFETGAQQING
jgi:hypothetical protein